MIVKTLNTPYYAVIFTSIQKEDIKGYSEMSASMTKLSAKQDGFLGLESAKDTIGITVSYWKDLDSIKKWKANEAHLVAQQKGKTEWYKSYMVRIALVEREYSFGEEYNL